ncbi:MAG: hypothetical protein JWN98_2559, partial [Abditibacteriota bacterium]|nr:hypothetical protein [Abditibacteriota bacterium]
GSIEELGHGAKVLESGAEKIW